MARNTRSSGKEMTMISRDGVDVSSLTDDELIGMLEERRAEIGPVTDTTRIVYQKKLLKLLDAEVRPGGRKVTQSRYVRQEVEEDDYVNVSRHGDDEDDEVENDEEEEERREYRSSVPKDYQSRDIRVRQAYRSDSPRTYQEQSSSTGRGWKLDADSGSTQRTQYSSSYETRYTTGDLSRPSLARPSLLPDQSQGRVKQQKGSWCPLWFQFLILLIVSAAVFFVLQTMDVGLPTVGLLDHFSSVEKNVST